MDDDLHDIDKLFYDALEPEAQPPSEKVWAEIDKQLDEENNKKPLLVYWAKGVAFIAVLLLILGAYLFYNHQQTTKNENNQIHQNQSSNYNSIEKDSAKIKLTKSDEHTTQKNNIIPINKDKEENKKQKPYAANKLNIVIKPTTNKQNATISQNSTLANVSSNSNNKQKGNFQYRKADSLVSKYNGNGNFKARKINQLEAIVHTKSNNNNPFKKIKSDINPTLNKSVGDNILNKADEPEFENSRLLLANNFINEDIYTTKKSFLIPNLSQIKQPIEKLPLQKNAEGNVSKKITLKKPANQTAKFYVSVFADREWNGYQLQDDDDHGNRGSGRRDDDDKKSIEGREDEDPSFAIGLNIGYQLNKKLALETGLHIGCYKISTDSVKIYAENNAGNIAYKLNTSSGYSYLNGTIATTVGDSTTAQHIKQAVNYIGIPFLLRYKLGNAKLSFNPAAGVMFNFITSSKVDADLDGASGNAQTSSKLLGLKKMSVALIFNPSIYYQISKHISLGLEPYFNYNISPITKANVVDSYPYGIGLGAGIKYHF